MSKLTYDELNALYGEMSKEDREEEVVRLSTAIKDAKADLKAYSKGIREANKPMQEKIDYLLELLRK